MTTYETRIEKELSEARKLFEKGNYLLAEMALNEAIRYAKKDGVKLSDEAKELMKEFKEMYERRMVEELRKASELSKKGDESSAREALKRAGEYLKKMQKYEESLMEFFGRDF